MTIHIDIAKLGIALQDFDHAYLLTVSVEGLVKVNTVDPVVDGETLRIDIPAVQARSNISANPTVTIVWPPRERHGHTLIVDGEATSTPDAILVRPGHALLHRPAAHADGPAPRADDLGVEDGKPA